VSQEFRVLGRRLNVIGANELCLLRENLRGLEIQVVSGVL